MAERGGVAEGVWRARLARFHTSGLTVKAFCERERVSASNFHAWKRRLKQGVKSENASSQRKANASRRTASGGAAQELFVPLPLGGLPLAGGAEVRIELPGGAVVRVPLEADDRVLGRVIEAAVQACVGGRSC